MQILFVLLITFSLFIFFLFKFRLDKQTEKRYKYIKKDFLISRAEHECYDALIKAVGDSYYIFPQLHLDSLLKGTTFGAFRHINEKSVDFIVCDKSHISPKLAIELDDHSHDLPSRKIRDKEVEAILGRVGLPLLRLKNHGTFVPDFLAKEINRLLSL